MNDHTTDPDLATDPELASVTAEAATGTPFTVDDVLNRARRLERTASICLRADLQGEWDQLITELATLVTPSGELLDDAVDQAAGHASARGRAMEINARLAELRQIMRTEMWEVRFRGMASDEWTPFVKQHKPKHETEDHTDFFNRLVAETAIAPTLTVEDVQKLRKVLTTTSIAKLSVTAWEACTEGGLDVPKLPLSLRNLAAKSSGS